MALMDEDGSGAVGVDEFEKWFGWLLSSDLNASSVFSAVDEDGSGALDLAETRQAIKALVSGKLSAEEVDEAVAAMDDDGSGEVTLAEFTEWWNVHQAKEKEREEMRKQQARKRRKTLQTRKRQVSLAAVDASNPASADEAQKSVLDELATQAQLLFEEVDTDGSGSLNRDELAQVYLSICDNRATY
jgi:Ca2+-binding EF-hand superfamily protein